MKKKEPIEENKRRHRRFSVQLKQEKKELYPSTLASIPPYSIRFTSNGIGTSLYSSACFVISYITFALTSSRCCFDSKTINENYIVSFGCAFVSSVNASGLCPQFLLVQDLPPWIPCIRVRRISSTSLFRPLSFFGVGTHRRRLY